MKNIDVVVVGNIAYDVNTFLNRDGEENKTVVNNGGACWYSLIPASLFANVGVVARVGFDFDVELFNKFNIDIEGLKVINDSKTTKFHHTYLSEDGKNRTFLPEVYEKTITSPLDTPKSYYKAKYFHVSTNFVDVQKVFIENIRANSSALISIDTHEAYMERDSESIKQLFDIVDIAFIDEGFTALLDCKAPVKIIKMGKRGCRYIDEYNDFVASSVIVENVIDKTGAGDVVTGVFLACISKGLTPQESLKIAVMVATDSITNYGVEHLNERVYTYKK